MEGVRMSSWDRRGEWAKAGLGSYEPVGGLRMV